MRAARKNRLRAPCYDLRVRFDMFTESAAFYDLIYSTFKDYPGEAARIAELLRELRPRCRTVLDVASGTGEHARLLAGMGFVVDGLDLDPAFVHRSAEASRRAILPRRHERLPAAAPI